MLNRRTFNKAVGIGTGATAAALAGFQNSANASTRGRDGVVPRRRPRPRPPRARTPRSGS